MMRYIADSGEVFCNRKAVQLGGFPGTQVLHLTHSSSGSKQAAESMLQSTAWAFRTSLFQTCKSTGCTERVAQGWDLCVSKNQSTTQCFEFDCCSQVSPCCYCYCCCCCYMFACLLLAYLHQEHEGLSDVVHRGQMGLCIGQINVLVHQPSKAVLACHNTQQDVHNTQQDTNKVLPCRQSLEVTRAHIYML